MQVPSMQALFGKVEGGNATYNLVSGIVDNFTNGAFSQNFPPSTHDGPQTVLAKLNGQMGGPTTIVLPSGYTDVAKYLQDNGLKPPTGSSIQDFSSVAEIMASDKPQWVKDMVATNVKGNQFVGVIPQSTTPAGTSSGSLPGVTNKPPAGPDPNANNSAGGFLGTSWEWIKTHTGFAITLAVAAGGALWMAFKPKKKNRRRTRRR